MKEPCALDICDGSGFVVDESARTAAPCRCRAQLVSRRKARSLSAVIPRRYAEVSFDRNPVATMPDRVVRPIRAYVRDLDSNLDAGRGLWLFGDVGTGKTTLAMLVARAALEAGRSVAIYSLPRLLNEIRRTYEEGSDSSYVQLLDRLAEVDLLHVDDLGAEKSSPWVLEQLYAIVNSRYEGERSMTITTNLDREPLVEQITARTVSRLEEMCEVIPVYGEDHRQVVGRQAS
jgi:DNA replication protein DnaC